jgi:hypothetical protein
MLGPRALQNFSARIPLRSAAPHGTTLPPFLWEKEQSLMRPAHFEEFFAVIVRQLVNHARYSIGRAPPEYGGTTVVLNTRNNHIRQPLR